MKSGESGLRGEQVEGKRAVLELLRARRRPVRTVFLARNVESDAVVDEIVELAGKRLEHVPSERLMAMARSDAPQGVLAQAAPLPAVDVDDLLDAPDALLVALDGVTDPRNLGAVLRSAETAGATGMVVPRHRSARLTPAVVKAAAGAIEYVPIATVAGIPAFIERASRKEVWSVGLDERGDAVRRRAGVRRPTGRARVRCRRPRARAAHARSLRRAGADPDVRTARVAERLGRGRARVSRGRAPTRGRTG